MPGHSKQAILFLPDENLTPALDAGFGPVSAEDAATLWRETGEAIHATPGHAPTPLAVTGDLRSALDAGDTAHWRGLMAAVLLSDVWPDCPPIRIRLLRREDSPLTAAALADSEADCLRLVLVGAEGQEACLGLADTENALVPAANLRPAIPFFSSHISWLDADHASFSDPIPALGRRERLVIAARLRAFRDCKAAQAFADDLQAVEERIAEASLHGAEAANYKTRMKAVHILRGLPGFERITCQEDGSSPVLTHPLLQTFSLRELLPAPEPGRVWRWEGVAFARDNGLIGLEPVGTNEEEDVLERLSEALRLLERHSAFFLRREAEQLATWDRGLERTAGEEAKSVVSVWQQRAETNALRPVAPLTVTCPVSADSPAIRLLLREQLGESLAELTRQPFSEHLLLLRGGDLGDETLTQCCMLRIGEQNYTALPPISEALAESIARNGWTDEGLQVDSFRLEAKASGHIEASLTIKGSGLVRCVRDYAPEEIQRPEAAPELSLWPAVPMEQKRWRAYYLSHRGVEIACLDGDVWTHSGAVNGNTTLRTDSFPWCVAVRREGRCVGALPCRAALCRPGERGIATVALDAGDAGVTMAMSFGAEPEPIQMPSLWRVLMRGPGAHLEETPLPVWPLGPVLPSAVLPHGELPKDPQPFTDGRICPEELGDKAKPLFPLIRRTDSEGLQGRRLLLREVMLLCSFHAVMHGAIGIRWRVALPSAMDGEQAERFLDTLRACAVRTEKLTGLLLAAGNPVELIRATQAEALTLRNGIAGPSFLMMDIGAASTGLAVCLYGMERPLLELRLRGGVMSGLLNALRARPACATDDLGEQGKPLLQALEQQRPDDVPWLLERLYGAHMPETMSAFAQKNMQGHGTWGQAVLLLIFAARCTVGGMALEALRRDTMLANHLPMELPLWMLGRGSRALSAMDEGTRMQLTTFLRVGMDMNHPVRFFRLALSDMPKLDTVRGLLDPDLNPNETPMLDSPITPISTEELTAQFLRQFALLLPGAAMLLFPGVFAQGGYLMPEMEERIQRAARQHQTTGAQAFLDTVDALLYESLNGIAETERLAASSVE